MVEAADRSSAATEHTRHFDHPTHHDDRHRRYSTTVAGAVEVGRDDVLHGAELDVQHEV